jgi:hypothetical protein
MKRDGRSGGCTAAKQPKVFQPQKLQANHGDGMDQDAQALGDFSP